MKAKIFALLEILLVYALMQAVSIAWRSTGVLQWEIANLGWSYTGTAIFVGVPALVIWLTRRNWAEYGVTLSAWQLNLDAGIKAYLVRIIPMVLGVGIVLWLGIGYKKLPGGAIVALTEIIGIAVMLWALNRQQEAKAIASARGNLITIGILLLFPIVVALAMGKLSLVIISTVVWQFLCSGFGEEFAWRGYVQSRLNAAFGRPYRLFGIQCGAGLLITSFLFGLLHAFNTFDSALGLASLAWGWGLFTAFGGLFFGLIREKTGSLLGCGLAHGLPDAVGEALARLMGWM
jgi:uncharacterized protein